MNNQPLSAPYYFVPGPSPYPILASLSILVFLGSAAAWVNHQAWAPWTAIVGLSGLLWVLRSWFSCSISESERGLYSLHIDHSFRWSMSWFIFSEVMLFAAFFGALFYAREISLPMLANLEHQRLWPGFSAVWPTLGPAGLVNAFKIIGPWPIPTLNTALLLSSGVTLTVAHHALLGNQRARAAFWLFATILLGIVFLCFQAYEYIHAYLELDLKLNSGFYGSIFFFLTGFHGFHVSMGVVMLSVILFRIVSGHFTPARHFGFEGVAWYWHFVDVVWLGLYISVYWM